MRVLRRPVETAAKADLRTCPVNCSFACITDLGHWPRERPVSEQATNRHSDRMPKSESLLGPLALGCLDFPKGTQNMPLYHVY